MGKTIFVTGTDTGVGKTLLTALLLTHLRAHGRDVLAMKPFCSGGLGDTRTLNKVLQGQIPMDTITPFQYAAPVAPLLAARMSRRMVSLGDVIAHIDRLAATCELLLVEGAGGLLVPLGDRYSVADVIKTLGCPVLLVARNKLGAINHTLLTVQVLRAIGIREIVIALMDRRKLDLAAKHNHQLLLELAAPLPVFRVPFLGTKATALDKLKINAKKIQKTLALISDTGIFSLALRQRRLRKKTAKKVAPQGSRAKV
jgi:dethiobiotin synthetase